MRIDRVQVKRYVALAAFTGSFIFILAVIVLASSRSGRRRASASAENPARHRLRAHGSFLGSIVLLAFAIFRTRGIIPPASSPPRCWAIATD
jgi:hypothetical protein